MVKALSSVNCKLLSFVRFFNVTDLSFFSFLAGSIVVPLTTLTAYFLVVHAIKFSGVTERVRRSSTFGEGGLCVFFLGCLTPVFLIVVLLDSVTGMLKVVSVW